MNVLRPLIHNTERDFEPRLPDDSVAITVARITATDSIDAEDIVIPIEDQAASDALNSASPPTSMNPPTIVVEPDTSSNEVTFLAMAKR